MRPTVSILRLPDSLGIPLPRYEDGVGTTMTLVAAVSAPVKLDPGKYVIIPTGFAFTLPLGMEAQIRSLVPLSETNGVVVMNAPATIDSSNQKEIKVLLLNRGENSLLIRRGEPIACLVFSPVLRVQWNEVNPPSEVIPAVREVKEFSASPDGALTPEIVQEALKSEVVQEEVPGVPLPPRVPVFEE